MRDAVTGVSASYDENAQMATVSITLDPADAYKTKYSSYDSNAGAELKEVPFQAVVTNDATGEVKTEKIYSSDGTSFATKAFSISRTEADQSFTVTLQANEGTQSNENWVDLSYNDGLNKTLTVPALVQAGKVVVSDKSGNYTLSLAGYTSPVLTATIYGADEKTLATHQTGTWSSSNTNIATISNGENSVAAGTVVLTGQTVGTVTFTFTADNGTPDKDDNVTGTSQTYTVVAGNNLALNIPGGPPASWRGRTKPPPCCGSPTQVCLPRARTSSIPLNCSRITIQRKSSWRGKRPKRLIKFPKRKPAS